MEFSGKIRGFALLFIISALLIWLVSGENRFSNLIKGKKDQPLKAENFKFTEVSRRDIHQKVLATGSVSLETGAEVKIGARISGQLEKLLVRIGNIVKAGDLIAVIEHEDLLARVAKFQADLKAEKARLKKIRMEGPLEIRKDKASLEEITIQLRLANKTLKRNLELREEGFVSRVAKLKADLKAEEARLEKIRMEGPLEISKDEASLEEITIQLRLANKTLKRNLELHEEGFVSASTVDEAEEKLEVLKARIKVAQDELDLQEAKLKNDIRLAEAEVEKAKANLMEEETQASTVDEAEEKLEVLKAKIKVAQDELDLQEAKLKNDIRLAEAEVEKAKANLMEEETQASTVDEAEEKVEVLGAKIKIAQEELNLQGARLENDIRLAEAGVEKAEANLMEEETQLSYADITAPIDGVVAFISTQEGETVVAGLSAPTFVTLIDLLKLEVTVFVDETDIGGIKAGQKAVFTVDAYSDKFFSGVVRDIHPKAVIKDNVVNYEAILAIDAKNIALLRPEMTANVVVTTGTRSQVLAIPKEAVKKMGKQSFAIVNLNGELIEEPIERGWRDEGFIEIISGLNENDKVGIPIKRKGKRPGRR